MRVNAYIESRSGSSDAAHDLCGEFEPEAFCSKLLETLRHGVSLTNCLAPYHLVIRIEQKTVGGLLRELCPETQQLTAEGSCEDEGLLACPVYTSVGVDCQSILLAAKALVNQVQPVSRTQCREIWKAAWAACRIVYYGRAGVMFPPGREAISCPSH